MVDQFSQRVNITVDVDVDEDLDKLNNIATGLSDIDDNIDSDTSKNLDEIRDSLTDFATETEDFQNAFSKFDPEDNLPDQDDPLANFRGAIRHTTGEVQGLQDELDRETQVNATIDSERFLSDVKNKLDRQIEEQDLTITPNFAGEVNMSGSAMQGILRDASEEIEGIEKTLKATDQRITLSYDTEGDMSHSLRKDINDLSDDLEERLTPALANTKEEMEELSNQADETNRAVGREGRSFKDLAGEADNLAELKRAATDANNELGTTSGLTAEEIAGERIEAMDLKDEFSDLNDEERGLMRRKIARRFRSAGGAARGAANGFNRVKSTLDDTNDKMRAASKVGELFEDGLGSLSLNVGAFTVALRNFLTQVPLFLAGLGALATAATAVAGAFVSAGAAIGLAIGAGAIAQARNLQEEHAEITETGQALQVMFAGIKDAFAEAFEPLIALPETVTLFERVIEGTAEVLSIFTTTFADNMDSIIRLVDLMGDGIMSAMQNVAGAMTTMIEELGPEIANMTEAAINGFANLLRFSTEFFDNIDGGMDTISSFIDATREMVKVGRELFGGLAPVIEAFSTILEEVASVINGMDQQFVSAAVSTVALALAVDRVAGIFGSVINLVPNLVASILRANGSVTSLTKGFAGFVSQHPAMAGGFTTLSQSANTFRDELQLMLADIHLAEEGFDDLDGAFSEHLAHAVSAADGMDEFEDELTSVALQMDISESKMEDVNDELQMLGINSRFATSNFDEFNEIDAKAPLSRRRAAGLQDDIDTDAANVEPPTVVGAVPDTIKNTGSKLKSAAGEAATFSKSLGRLAKSGVGRLVGKLGGLLTRLPLIGGALGSVGSAAASAGGTISAALLPVLGPLAPVILAIAAAGALAVGIIGNFDKISESLSGTMESAGSAVKDLGGYLLSTFIDLWNALVPAVEATLIAFQPLIDILSGGSGGDTDAFGLLLFAILEPLRILIDVIIDLIGFLAEIIRVFAMVVNVASTVLGVIFAITAAGLSLLKLGLAEAFEGFLNLGVGGTTIGDTLEYLGGLVDSLMSALDVDVMGFLENLLNGFIELVNDLLIGLNKIPGMNVGTVSTVGDSGLEVSEEDVRTNASGAVDQVAGSSPANINVNTDNSTNIDQTVNADPEDKATLSRVVSDAIEEANSFERRRAGSQ